MRFLHFRAERILLKQGAIRVVALGFLKAKSKRKQAKWAKPRSGPWYLVFRNGKVLRAQRILLILMLSAEGLQKN